MARRTASIDAIIRGLADGGQLGLADLVAAEIDRLEPRSLPKTSRRETAHEELRQVYVADQLITRVIKNEIGLRRGLRESAFRMGVRQVETIEAGPDEKPARIVDVLTDSGRIEALETFLETWQSQIGRFREGQLI
ncbi:hypothetical protein PQU94_07925 [Asticcacaulis sp. DXS10W]|uniref:Uncharacterized protein n=1 Tax=Asticcacaulis currens TaxID=2984210 RepID=A0ABT5IDG5_9CAUL|nr:hypothetical protein [Asticcacaulis currens]MDC7694209.1 hypothetical protein [Asticcacaulis currens]